MSQVQWMSLANAGMLSVFGEENKTRFGGFRAAVCLERVCMHAMTILM